LTWLKDGAPLPASNRFTTQYDINTGVARLKINDSVLNDAGIYTVVAENKAGSDRTNGRLEIEKESGIDTQPIVSPGAFAGQPGGHHIPPAPPQPPQFGGEEPMRPAKVVIPLQNTQVPDGKPVRLPCRVDGHPRPTVVWYKNGMPLPASNRYAPEYDVKTGVVALRIESTQLNDSARYEVFCDNPLGSDRTYANLVIDPSAAIDRAPIVDPRSFRYLDPVALAPQEVYRGPDVDRVEPPRVVIPLKDMRVPEGQNVCLLTKITGSPLPRIVWLHNNQPLLESSRYISTYDHTTNVASFKINGTQVNDLGTYTALADNIAGQCYTTCVLQLTQDSLVDTTPIVNPDAFKYLEKPTLSHPHKKPPTEAVVHDAPPSSMRPPKFIVPLSDVHVNEGTVCQVTCKLEGYPFPTVSWFKDGRPLPASNRTLVHYNLNSGIVSLKIGDVQLGDNGHYTVIAQNKAGQDQTQGSIHVTQMPGVDNSSMVNPDAFRYLDSPRDAASAPSRRPEDRDRLNYKPPKFIIPLANIKINEGQPAHLAAKVDGYPKPRVSLFLQQKNLSFLFI
jgi:hypothetical protein